MLIVCGWSSECVVCLSSRMTDNGRCESNRTGSLHICKPFLREGCASRLALRDGSICPCSAEVFSLLVCLFPRSLYRWTLAFAVKHNVRCISTQKIEPLVVRRTSLRFSGTEVSRLKVTAGNIERGAMWVSSVCWCVVARMPPTTDLDR